MDAVEVGGDGAWAGRSGGEGEVETGDEGRFLDPPSPPSLASRDPALGRIRAMVAGE